MDESDGCSSHFAIGAAATLEISGGGQEGQQPSEFEGHSAIRALTVDCRRDLGGAESKGGADDDLAQRKLGWVMVDRAEMELVESLHGSRQRARFTCEFGARTRYV